MKPRHGVTIAVLILVAAFLAYTIRSRRQVQHSEVRSLRTAQEADAPDGDPREFASGWFVPPFDQRLQMLSGIDRMRVPHAERLDFPMGTEAGAFTYNAQSFWEMNQDRGGHHTGDDLNGIGGMNSDLGDPVYAIGNGLVIYAGEPDPSWGNTLLIAHRLSDGRLVQSMYAHLESIAAAFDEPVVRGQLIGRVGNANGAYLAHLHFEMHEDAGPSIGQGYVNYRTNRIDPSGTVTAFHADDPDSLGSSMGQIVKTIERDQLGIPIGQPAPTPEEDAEN